MAGLLSWLNNERKIVQHDIANGAAAAVHGLNPFDGGQGFTTQKPVQAPQPAPQPQQNNGWSVGRVLHDVTHNPVTNLPQTISNDVFKPVQRDIVRPIANLPQTFGNDVLQPLQRDVVKPAVNVAQGLASPFEYLAKADIINPARQLAAQFSHNDVAARNAQLATNRNLGLGDNGTNFTGGLRTFAGNAAQVGLDALAPGIGGAVGKSFTAVVPKVVPGLLTRTVANAGTGAVLGAPFNATAVVADPNIPLTRQNLQNAALQGAQMGAVLGGAGTVAAAVAPKVIQGLRNIPRAQRLISVKGAAASKPLTRIPVTKLTPTDISGYGELDPSRVQKYRQQIRQTGKIDPILAMRGNGSKLFVEDGKHRLAAAKAEGLKSIPAKIVTPEEVHQLAQGGYVSLPGRRGAASDNEPTGKTTPSLPTDSGEMLSSTSNHQVSSKNSVAPAGKYKSETGSGTITFDTLTPKNSFQDVNGVRHPLQSNARITIQQPDGYTKTFNVNNISSQRNFNNQLVRYGERGKLLSVNIDETPALNTPKVSSLAPKSSVRASVSDVQPAPGRAPQIEKYSVAQPAKGSSRGSGQKNILSPAEPLQSASINTRSRSISRNQPESGVSRVAKTSPLAEKTGQVPTVEKQNTYPQSTRTKGFSQSVKNSSEVSPVVQKRSGGEYQTRNTQKMVDKSEARVKNSLSSAVDSTLAAVNRKKGSITDQEVSDAISTAKRLDANKNYAQATEIYDKLDEHLRQHGRAIQAASVLNRRTPEGIRHSAFAELKKHGVDVTPEFERAMMKKIEDIKATKPGSLERDLNIKQLQKLVTKQIPSDLADKLSGTWKAGLLTGIRTQTGNALSNETFSVLHNLSNLLSAPLDKTASLFTGQRTKTLTGRGLVSGTKEGFSQGLKYLKTGIDERSPLENKFMEGHGRELNFKNKAMNTYVNGVFRLMGAADRPHYYRQLRNSLYDLGKADGLNKGLKGQALRTHVDEFVKNPSVEQFQRATHEAEQAVLANDTLLATAAGKLQKLSDEAKSPVGKFVAKVAINGIAPFTRVPSAFLSRVIDYTPAGAIKEGIIQASRRQFDQRALVNAIAESTTGTGLILLGSALAQNKLLSGNYPTDPKEQQRWKAQGIQPNSIKLGNTWVSMNYLGPVGMLFAAGSRMNDVKTAHGTLGQQAIAAASGVPKDLTEQSFLQGLSGAMQAVNEPGRYANNYIKSQVGSAVPTIVNDLATATDSKQRQTDTVPDRVKSRIPGLRETLKPAQDVYGNALARKTGPINSMINPFRPSSAITNNVKQEVERLHNADPNNSDLQVTPTTVDKSVSINGKRVPINDSQRYTLQKRVGQATQADWSKLIQTPEYKALSDEDKAQALTNLRQDATTLATRQFVLDNNLGTYKKSPSSKVIALGEGNANIADYATQVGSSSAGATVTLAPALGKQYKAVLTKYASTADRTKAFNTQKDAEYQYDLAKYNNDIAKGTLTTAEKIRTQKTLQKEKVGSVYPKNVRDLYSLSKTELNNYLTTPEKGVDKAKIAKQLIAYDQALYNAGLETYLKFKTGIAPSKGGSGGGGSKFSATAAQLRFNAARKAPKVATFSGLPKAPAKYTAPTLRKYAVKSAPSKGNFTYSVRKGLV